MEDIYFIIYLTYIIVTATCFALSSVLYLTKGIKTPLSNNKSYIKGKNLIATGILMEGFVHLLMFITIVLGYDYQHVRVCHTHHLLHPDNRHLCGPSDLPLF